MTWLVLLVPVTIGLEVFVPEHYLLIFAASSLAILPLAGPDSLNPPYETAPAEAVDRGEYREAAGAVVQFHRRKNAA